MEGVGVTAGAPASQVSSPTGASTPPASALPWVEGGAESRVSDARSHACRTRRVTHVVCVESRVSDVCVGRAVPVRGCTSEPPKGA